MKDLSKKMLSSVGWTVLFRLAERSLGLVSTLILVRLLIPEDFGLMAMAASVIGVLELIHAFGFDAALIQKRDAQQYHFNTVWTVRIILYGLMSCMIVALAIPVSEFYADERLVPIMWVLAIGWFIQGFENVGIIRFQKDLQFNREFRFRIYKKVFSFIVTVCLALYTRSYWALVAGMVTGRVAGVILSYLMHEMRPSFGLKGWREIFNYTKWMFLSNIIWVIKLRFPDFLLGKLLGARTLGLYTIAYEISNLPSTELTAPINRAMLPAYSTISDSIESLRYQYLNVLSAILLIILPITFGIASTATHIVPILLGEKWLDTTPLIEILAFYGATVVAVSNIGPAFMALGKPKIITIVSFFGLLVSAPLVFWLTQKHNEIGTVTGLLLGNLVLLPAYYTMIIRELNIPIKDFFFRTYRPVIAATTMYLLLRNVIEPALPQELNHFFSLLALVLAGALTYLVTIYTLWKVNGSPSTSTEQFLLDKLSQTIKRS